MPTQRKFGSPAQAGAGVAGGGCGTVLVLLAKNLSDDNSYKSWALILAPWIAVIITAAVTWARRALVDYLERRQTETAFLRAKKTLAEGLNNPLTSQQHKEELRRKWEQLEQLIADSEVEVVVTSPMVSHSQSSRGLKRPRN